MAWATLFNLIGNTFIIGGLYTETETKEKIIEWLNTHHLPRWMQWPIRTLFGILLEEHFTSRNQKKQTIQMVALKETWRNFHDKGPPGKW